MMAAEKLPPDMSMMSDKDLASGPHIPVMLREVISAMRPKDGDTYVDATFGAGGYTRALLEAADCKVIGLDRDPRAIAAGQALQAEYPGRLTLIETPFAEMGQALSGITAEAKSAAIDGIVFDLGVSSMQLDEADRGFSFRQEGPLSMRMDGAKPDAADVINQASAEDLKIIFRIYGEEKFAAPIARAIVAARDISPITTTKVLAELIEGVVPARPPKRGGRMIHPATRVFQALRIFVNAELRQLAEGLVAAEGLLSSGGRLVAVSFHSLEARIVKRFFLDRTRGLQTASRHAPEIDQLEPTFILPFRGQLDPSADEQAHNARSRSASLRAGVRTSASPRSATLEFANLPRFSFSPTLSELEIV